MSGLGIKSLFLSIGWNLTSIKKCQKYQKLALSVWSDILQTQILKDILLGISTKTSKKGRMLASVLEKFQ